MHFTITCTIRRGYMHAAHGGRAHVPQLRLRPTSRCARLAPALDSRPRLTRVRAPPASALHPRPCYTRACAPGVLVPVGAATCLVFVSLAGLLLVRCSSSLVLLLLRCSFFFGVATGLVLALLQHCYTLHSHLCYELLLLGPRRKRAADERAAACMPRSPPRASTAPSPCG